MNTDKLRASVATLYRRKGKHYLTDEEFIYAASMEVRWFTPAKAALFLRNAKMYGLLSPTVKGLRPTFEVDDSSIAQIISTPTEVAEETVDVVAAVLEMVSIATKVPKSEVMSRINRLKKELNLETQAAATLVAAQSGQYVAGLAQGGLDELIKSYNK